MWGVHVQTRSRTVVGLVCRELCLLAFVAGITYLSAGRLAVDWGPVHWLGDSMAPWAIVGGSALPVLARLRWPTAALLAAAALFGCSPATGVAVAATAYHAGGRIQSTRRRIGTLGAAAVLPSAIGLSLSGFQWQFTVAVYGTAALVYLAVPSTARVLLEQADRLIRALRDRMSYLEGSFRLVSSAARLQERSRIAEEMHDQLGHRLSLISLHAGALQLETAGSSSTVTDEARLIRNTVHTAMQEFRTMLGGLRDADHEGGVSRHPEEIGTRADITRLVAESRAAGVAVELAWTGDDLTGDDLTGVADPVRRAVHHVVREGLTNVHRHAAGTLAKVLIERGAAGVRVHVSNSRGQDLGTGTHPPGTGWGLVGMRERVRRLGGTVAAGSAPDGGFRLSVELPFDIPLSARSFISEPVPPRQAADPEPPIAGPTADGRTTGTDRWRQVGLSAVLATALVGAVAVVILVVSSVPVARHRHKMPAFDLVRTGMRATEVAAIVGGDDPRARWAARTIEPKPPPKTACWYVFSWTENATFDVIERYCFTADQLVDKTQFDAPAT